VRLPRRGPGGLAYEVLGERGPLLLVVHGGPGMDHASLRPWLDPVADQARLVYFDLPGHGQSAAPTDYHLEAMADAVEGLADHLAGRAGGLYAPRMQLQARRRRALRLILAGTGLGLLTACAPQPTAVPTSPPAPTTAPATPTALPRPEPDAIKITYGTQSASTTPLWLAIDKGLFKKHGLNAEATFGSSVVGAAAVVSGEAHFFLGEAASTFQAVAERVPVELVAFMQKLNIFKFMVRPEIAGPENLKGKSIAISAAGDSTDISTRSALTSLGLQVGRDVSLVQVGNSGPRLAAVMTGQMAGSLLSEPTATQAAQQGLKVLLDSTTAPFPAGGVTVSKDFAAKNPRTVGAFLRGLVEGIRFLTDPANKDEALAVMARYQNAQPTDAVGLQGYQQYSGDVLARDPSPDRASAQAMLDGFKSYDPSRFANLSVEQVIDPSFAAELRTSGFLQSVWGDQLPPPSA
jgi:ABC-type nitrate/sulfonate/bicarbonate transport system substrate-binding protein